MFSSIKRFLTQPVTLRRPGAGGPRRQRGGGRPLGLRAGIFFRRASARLRDGLDGLTPRPASGRRRPRSLRPRSVSAPSGSFRLGTPSLGLSVPRLRLGGRFGRGGAPAAPKAASVEAVVAPVAKIRRRSSGSARRRSSGDVVGLDIQPGFIAAVEANVNGSIRAARAATAPLEGDVVPEGEVADETALSDALRELFAGSGMGSRVRVGVANQRTVLRILEIPPLTDAKELAAAVRFQAQDQVPMPLSNAVLDFHPLGVADTPNGPRQRVVLVAAQRDMVERLLGAVRSAGLRPVGVDLSAFAMIRALFHPDPEHAGRVLYLNVDGLTNLAIAEGTSCRFNRVVGVGLEGMADELAKRSGISRSEARSLLAGVDLTAPISSEASRHEAEQDRYAAGQTPYAGEQSAYAGEPSVPVSGYTEPAFTEPRAPGDQPGADPEPSMAGVGAPVSDVEAAALNDAREVREMAMSFAQSAPSPVPAPGAARTPSTLEVRTALESGIRELVGEVRNTLDFYASQDGGGNVSRVVLSGQALNVAGFAESLQAGLGMQVHAEAVGLLDESLAARVSPGRLAVAAGLATVEAPA
jgi:type IV pilus assembly protein PilM